jgi:hypothetical protein
MEIRAAVLDLLQGDTAYVASIIRIFFLTFHSELAKREQPYILSHIQNFFAEPQIMKYYSC